MTVIWFRNITDRLRGRISNIFFRISSNTYVAKITKRARNSIIEMIERENVEGDIVISWIEDSLIEMVSIGNNKQIIDLNGIKLINNKEKNNEQLD